MNNDATTPTGTEPLQTSNSRPKRLLTMGLGVALAAALLAVAVLGTMLATGSSTGEDRTVSVTGEATIKATPDEYVFYPSYSFSDADKEAALAALSKKSDEVVAGLKKLGVADKEIKSNSDGYDSPRYYAPSPDDSDKVTYNLQLTVTLANKDLVQKVQDYLVATAPTGGVSPQADFSDSKRKQLESDARDEATKDARSKADQSAKNLGFKVGKVKSVDDGSGFGDMPYATSKAESGAALDFAATPSLSVQSGENELSYSVTVVYEIR